MARSAGDDIHFMGAGFAMSMELRV